MKLSEISLKVLAHIICQKSDVSFYTADLPEMGGNRAAIMSALVTSGMITKVRDERPRQFKLTKHGEKYGSRYADQYISSMKSGGEL